MKLKQPHLPFFPTRIIIALGHLILAGLAVFSFSGSASAQKRDHLTDAETELIRFHQELDKRIEVLIKAADRRMAIINGTSQPDTRKKSVKDEPDWGEIPKGSRADLINDIAGILDEAITNIDDVGRRDEKNPLISRSLRRLTAAANLYAGQFNLIQSHTSNEDELSAIQRALDYAQQIMEVGSKLPPPAPEKKTKSKP
jgi:hypothetical protein